MEVLLNRVFVGIDDKGIEDEQGIPLTLCKMGMLTLSYNYTDEQGLSGEEKFKRYELYLKLKNSPNPVDLTTEEIVMIKKLIGKAYGPVLMGQAWMMLEGKV